MIVDLTTDTFGAVERHLDGEYSGSNVNRFVAIKAPGSAASEKSAASSCHDMKGKRAMNKTAEPPLFVTKYVTLAPFCSIFVQVGESVWLAEMLEISRNVG